MSLCWRSFLEEGIQIILDRFETFHVCLGRGGTDYSRRGTYSGSDARKGDVLECIRYPIALYFDGGILCISDKNGCDLNREHTTPLITVVCEDSGSIGRPANRLVNCGGSTVSSWFWETLDDK